MLLNNTRYVRNCSTVCRITCLALVCILLLSGCTVGNAEFQPLRVGSLPWIDGEVTLYQITDAQGRQAGQMRITLLPVDAESHLMRREIGGAFRELLEILMKADTLRPIETNLTRTHTDGVESINTLYDGGQVDMRFTTKLNVTTDERHSIPSDTYDYRSIMMVLRTLPLERRYATRVNVYLPISGILERMELIVNKNETVEVPAGAFETWKVLMRTRSSRSEAWISVEAPFLLVKYVDGSNGATFELTEIQTEP